MTMADRRLLAERLRPIVNRCRECVEYGNGYNPKPYRHYLQPKPIMDGIPAIHKEYADCRLYETPNDVKNRMDTDAEFEGLSIHRHRILTIKPGGRDDNKIRSKNYYLRNNVATRLTTRRRQHRHGRQINLQHLGICERLNNPALYAACRE